MEKSFSTILKSIWLLALALGFVVVGCAASGVKAHQQEEPETNINQSQMEKVDLEDLDGLIAG